MGEKYLPTKYSCFGKNIKYNNKKSNQGQEAFNFFNSFFCSQDFGCIFPEDPASAAYLFLISFSNVVSLSYPNSPPAGRGTFMMSAWVATRTTRSGFFSLPPKAGGRERTVLETGPPSWLPLPSRWGRVCSLASGPSCLQVDVQLPENLRAPCLLCQVTSGPQARPKTEWAYILGLKESCSEMDQNQPQNRR